MAIGNHSLPTNIITTYGNGSLYGYSKWAYNATGGLFWTMMLLAFCVALMISTLRLGTKRAFGFGSFAGLIGSIFLATLQLMPWWITTAFILVGTIGIVGMIMNEKD